MSYVENGWETEDTRAKYLFHRLEKMRAEHARQEGVVRDYTMLNEDNSVEALERVLNHTD